MRVSFEPDRVVVELPEVRAEHRGGLGTAAVNGLVLAGLFDLAVGSTVVLLDPRRDLVHTGKLLGSRGVCAPRGAGS